MEKEWKRSGESGEGEESRVNGKNGENRDRVKREGKVEREKERR